MPLREVPLFHRSKTLQRLQRLVQLSDTPFVQVFMTVFTRYQLWLLAIVFGVTLIFAIRHPNFSLILKRQVAIAFFSAVSQSLAALLGVLISFSDCDRTILDFRF